MDLEPGETNSPAPHLLNVPLGFSGDISFPSFHIHPQKRWSNIWSNLHLLNSFISTHFIPNITFPSSLPVQN